MFSTGASGGGILPGGKFLPLTDIRSVGRVGGFVLPNAYGKTARAAAWRAGSDGSQLCGRCWRSGGTRADRIIDPARKEGAAARLPVSNAILAPGGREPGVQHPCTGMAGWWKRRWMVREIPCNHSSCWQRSAPEVPDVDAGNALAGGRWRARGRVQGSERTRTASARRSPARRPMGQGRHGGARRRRRPAAGRHGGEKSARPQRPARSTPCAPGVRGTPSARHGCCRTGPARRGPGRRRARRGGGLPGVRSMLGRGRPGDGAKILRWRLVTNASVLMAALKERQRAH